MEVVNGDDKAFAITPDVGYEMDTVTVDDKVYPSDSIDGLTITQGVGHYTFSNVTEDHSISATFKVKPIYHTITATAGEHGNISSAGGISVVSGAAVAYTITPNSGYKIASVRVDGTAVDYDEVDGVGTYTFPNVQKNHTIAATFVDAIHIGDPLNFGTVYASDTAPSNVKSVEVRNDSPMPVSLGIPWTTSPYYRIMIDSDWPGMLGVGESARFDVKLKGPIPSGARADVISIPLGGTDRSLDTRVISSDKLFNEIGEGGRIYLDHASGFFMEFSKETFLYPYLSKHASTFYRFVLEPDPGYVVTSFDAYVIDPQGNRHEALPNVKISYSRPAGAGGHYIESLFGSVRQGYQGWGGEYSDWGGGDITITATFEKSFSDFTQNTTLEHGTLRISGVEEIGHVLTGSDVDFTITPEKGYHVTGITDNASPVTEGAYSRDPETDVVAYTVRNINVAHRIDASFARNTYTVAFDPSGGAVSPAAIGEVVFGDAYNFDADIENFPTPIWTADTYHRFDGWYAPKSDRLVTAGAILDEDYVNGARFALVAKWRDIRPEVSFRADDAQIYGGAGKLVIPGQPYGTLPIAIHDQFPDYTFEGWYTGENGGGTAVTSETVAGAVDTALFAWFKPAVYKLIFDTRGGSLTESTKDVAYGTACGALPTPERTGYTFGGWYNEVACTTAAKDTDLFTARGTKTLYAKWTAVPTGGGTDKPGSGANSDGDGDTLKTVTINTTGGSAVVAKVGEKISDIAKPTQKGYTFKGWYTEAKGGTKYSGTTTITADSRIYAQWTANKYKIKYDANKGKVKVKSKQVTYASKYGKLAKPTRAGYSFKGWYTKKNGGTKVTKATKVKITKTTTLYAHWKRK